jgi:hypothetical protein
VYALLERGETLPTAANRAGPPGSVATDQHAEVG